MAHTLPCGHHVAHDHQPHYCDYLRLSELLQLQPPAEQLRHPDEHLFVTTHQSIEIWFKQIIFELQRCIESLDSDNVGLAIWLIRRINRISAILTTTLQLMDSMAPSDFFAFRPYLAPASGAESQQFREIELLVGVRNPEYRCALERLGQEPGQPATRMWTERMQALWESRSLRAALLELFERRKLAPEDVYVVAPQPNPDADLFLLIEELLDFDEAMTLWRAAHARIAERAIGPILSGTAHSSGISHLEATIASRRFFPELWQARTRLWEQRVKAIGSSAEHACPRLPSSFTPAPGSAHE
ncbi:MAG TPA: tryptophan 2,3-dioxygenase family protein [Herpetosiphonaceae bacterium]